MARSGCPGLVVEEVPPLQTATWFQKGESMNGWRGNGESARPHLKSAAARARVDRSTSLTYSSARLLNHYSPINTPTRQPPPMQCLRRTRPPCPLTTRRQGSGHAAHALKDNFARLSIAHPPDTIARVVVSDAATSAELATIPNAEGKRASLVFYAALAANSAGGLIDAQAAADGLALFDEVVADARAHRGSHPNIDLLLDVQSGAIGPLRVAVVRTQEREEVF